LPIAVRVLVADAARDGCGAVLLLSPITRLLGRGDTTRSRRSSRHQSAAASRQRCRSRADCERADAERSWKLLAASVRGAFIQA
jgi:hypothetical protein